jgi:peptide/nickel transport system substrate-binding protein
MQAIHNLHRAMILGSVTAALTLCGAWPLPIAMIRRAAASDEPALSIYHEAPQLQQQVASGKIPPIDARLPRSPFLVQPFARIGRYGGTWHRAIRPTRDQASFIRIIGYENLMRWDPLWINVIPNIAERYEVNPAATVYTFYLREGMRWSDGMPFTADDILFWYEDVFLNKELTPSIPAWLTSGGKPVKVTKRDATTVSFTFEVPNGLFLMNLAAPWGAEPTEYPRHYLQQFLPRYNPQGIAPLLAQTAQPSWPALFRAKAGSEVDHPSRWQNPALPRLHAWLLTTPYASDAQEIVARRNPYYWKIDPAGNQLPYIDRIVYKVFDDRPQLEEMLRKGAIDMQTRHIPQNWFAAEGHAQTFTLISSFSNTAVISLNLTHRNPTLRRLFQNKDFRIGLSHAIDRQAIIAKVFAGEGEPYQVAPKPESPFYHKRLALQYTEYDVALANAYLDKACGTARDAAGYRLRPDGRRIRIALDVIDFLSMLEVTRLIPDYWRAVGIETRLNILEREAFYARKSANRHDADVWVGDGGLEVLLEPRWYFPSSCIESNYAIPWACWYSNPADPRAEPPPIVVQQQMTRYDQIRTTADQTKQYALMSEILDIAADQFYVIGISTPPLRYGILRTGFANVPNFIPHSWTYPHPAPTNPCQYFIEEK